MAALPYGAGAGKAGDRDPTILVKAEERYLRILTRWLAPFVAVWLLFGCANVATERPLRGEMGHVAIAVQQLERSVEWYRNTFGFKQIGEVYQISTDDSPLGKVALALFGRQTHPIRLAQLTTPSGASVELFEFNGHPATKPDAMSGILHLALVVDDFYAAQTRLAKLGVAPLVENFSNPRRKVAFYKDLDAHIIELTSLHWDPR
jgi:catechol 2,3-dioxygenase-like lactoylglutathione lyase family enzyme